MLVAASTHPSAVGEYLELENFDLHTVVVIS
jgi:hypothetical protein